MESVLTTYLDALSTLSNGAQDVACGEGDGSELERYHFAFETVSFGGMCNLERWDDLTKAINSNASWPSARARNPKAGLGFHQDFLTYTYTYTDIQYLP